MSISLYNMDLKLSSDPYPFKLIENATRSELTNFEWRLANAIALQTEALLLLFAFSLAPTVEPVENHLRLSLFANVEPAKS